MGTLRYKGYTGSVEYCDEDECLYGKVLGMDGNQITYEGKSIEELKSDFEGAVDFYIDCCHERGIEPQKNSVRKVYTDNADRTIFKSDGSGFINGIYHK